VQLTCIGTGTAYPDAERAGAGFILETGGLRILFDCGPAVVQGMARHKVDWRGITHLALTHFHNDHTGDVPALFFAWMYGMRPVRSAPITVLGPKGTAGLLKAMAAVFGRHLTDPPFAIMVQEMEDDGELRLNDVVRIRARHTPHTENSLAWRVEADGRSFCYTGDTGMSESVAIFAQAADVLLIECSLPAEEKMEEHLTPGDVAQIARIALPRRLLVTHVYPQLDVYELPFLVRDGGWPAAVEVVKDGQRIEV
jgi:ribonuclease BN (tRNA processing enzyme)